MQLCNHTNKGENMKTRKDANKGCFVCPVISGGQTVGEMFGATEQEAEGRAALAAYAVQHMKA